MNNESNKSGIAKIWSTLFSYGGKNANGDLVVTAIVSDSYESLQNGKKEVKYETVLKASMVITTALASEFLWTPFETANGKKGIKARVSIFVDLGDRGISMDKREGAGMKFWLNPAMRKPVVQPDGSRKWVECLQDDPEAKPMIFAVRERTEVAKEVKTSEEVKAPAKTSKSEQIKKAVTPRKVVSTSAAPF